MRVSLLSLLFKETGRSVANSIVMDQEPFTSASCMLLLQQLFEATVNIK